MRNHFGVLTELDNGHFDSGVLFVATVLCDFGVSITGTVARFYERRAGHGSPTHLKKNPHEGLGRGGQLQVCPNNRHLKCEFVLSQVSNLHVNKDCLLHELDLGKVF